jgi:hypothetical protein
MSKTVLARALVAGVLLASSLWFASASGQAPAQAPAQVPAQPPAESATPLSFKVLADQLKAQFPIVQADVVEVTDSRVILAAGRGEGLQPGVEMIGYREGRELVHPRTKQSLGKTEETLGRLVVAQVFENYSVATHVDGQKVQVGDRARVSAGKVRLTVLPLASASRPKVAEVAVQEVLQELDRVGRFQIAFGDQVLGWIGQEKISTEDFLKGKRVTEALQKFNVAHLLALGFSTVDNKLFMDVRLFSRSSQAPLFETALLVPASVKPRPAQQFSAGGTGDVKVEKRSLLARLLSGDWEPNKYSAGASSIPVRLLATFPFLVQSMDAAVAPADKQSRLVVTDGQKVFGYRVNGEKLDAEWTYDKMMVGKIISVQFIDVDGDGVLEVVVNRQDVKAGMLSYIIGMRQGKPVGIAMDTSLLLLAVDEQGDGVNRVLWGTPQDSMAFFTRGSATRYILKGNDLSATTRAYVPDTFRLTGATFSNISGKDSRALAYVDQWGRLRIAAGANEMWRSLTVVGGGIALAQIQIPMFQTYVDKFFKMEPNPVAVDLDGDGLQEVLVPVNDEEAGRLAVVYRGPAGFRMQVVQSGFEGLISGVGAIRGEAGTSLLLAVLRRSGLLRDRGETQIVMTLPE